MQAQSLRNAHLGRVAEPIAQRDEHLNGEKLVPVALGGFGKYCMMVGKYTLLWLAVVGKQAAGMEGRNI